MLFTIKLAFFYILAIVVCQADKSQEAALKIGKPGELSRIKCKEYTKYMPNECPFLKPDLVIGNEFAGETELPHMAMLGHKVEGIVRWLCGGALISEDTIIIAGHCINSPEFRSEFARLGNADLNSTEHIQIIDIKKLIVHPGYRAPAFYNDIGLVKLAKKVEFNEFVRPACLFVDKEVGFSKVQVIGWGPTELYGDFNYNLQKVNLDLYDQPVCNETYMNHAGSFRLEHGVTYDTMICAGSKSLETFQPRTGSIMETYHKDDNNEYKCMYEVMGAGAFGIKAGQDKPSVFTRFTAFLPWVEEIVWKTTF